MKNGTNLPDVNANEPTKMQRPPLSEVLLEYSFNTAALLLPFILGRNALAWFLMTTLGWDTDFFEEKWRKLVDKYEDPVYLYSIGGFVVSNTVYWSWGGFYCLLNWTGWLKRYKVQEGTNDPPERAKFIKGLLQVLFNQTVIAIPVAIAGYYLSKLSGTERPLEYIRSLPPFNTMLMDLVFCVLAHEVTFYVSHVIFHHKSIYKYIHKKHHEWTSPMGIMAAYAHPIEHVLSNMLPVIIGPMMLGPHPLSMWMWFVFAIYRTVNNHSGYHLPFIQSPEFHDYHHLNFNQNYGTIGLLDHLTGTDSMWRKTQSKRRHTTFYSLVPARLLFPDNKGD